MGIATVLAGGFFALFQKRDAAPTVDFEPSDEEASDHWAQIYSDVPVIRTDLENLLLDESYDCDAPTQPREDEIRRLRRLTRH